MPIYEVPADPAQEPLLTVRQYFAGKSLTEAQLKVAERIARECWEHCYGRLPKDVRLRSGDYKFELIYLEEIEDAMLGSKAKYEEFERMLLRTALLRMNTIYSLIAEYGGLVPGELPNPLPSISDRRGPEHLLEEAMELWDALLMDLGEFKLHRAMALSQSKGLGEFYHGVVYCCRQLAGGRLTPMLEMARAINHSYPARV